MKKKGAAVHMGEKDLQEKSHRRQEGRRLVKKAEGYNLEENGQSIFNPEK